MSARVTRSRTRAAASRCHLIEVSHDELGVIFDGLADPLQPVVAVALSSTCEGLRTPLGPALQVLQQRHARARALACKVQTDPYARTKVRNPSVAIAELHDTDELSCEGISMTEDDLATLGMLFHTNGLPKLSAIWLGTSGDAGLIALCAGMIRGISARGVASSLCTLALPGNQLGPAGAEALAAALGRGALPKLVDLILPRNPLGDQGIAALAPAVRKLPVLDYLDLEACNIGNKGAASLLAGLTKGEFKELTYIDLDSNRLTDEGCAMILSSLKQGGLPKLGEVGLEGNPVTPAPDGHDPPAIVEVEDFLLARQSAD